MDDARRSTAPETAPADQNLAFRAHATWGIRQLASIAASAETVTVQNARIRELLRRAQLARPYLERLQLPEANTAPEISLRAVSHLSKSLKRTSGAVKECGRGWLYCTLNFAGAKERIDAAWKALGDAFVEVGEWKLLLLEEKDLPEPEETEHQEFGLIESVMRRCQLQPESVFADLLAHGKITKKDMAECRDGMLEQLQDLESFSGESEGEQKRKEDKMYLEKIIACLEEMCPDIRGRKPEVPVPRGYLCKTCERSSKSRLREIDDFMRQFGDLEATVSERPTSPAGAQGTSQTPCTTSAAPRNVSKPRAPDPTPEPTPSAPRSVSKPRAPDPTPAPTPSAPRSASKPRAPDPTPEPTPSAETLPNLGTSTRGASEPDISPPDYYVDEKGVPWSWSIVAGTSLIPAQQGNPQAQNLLAFCLQYGKGVPKKDPQQAVVWYRKAAKQGDHLAMYNLGLCLKTGQGVTKNLSAAADWFRKAAEKGDPVAQHSLGCCYRFGDGVPKDLKEAVRWLSKSAEKGNSAAQNELGDCFYHGLGVPKKDFAKAAGLYRKAAEKGNAKAQESLGHCFQNGEGVVRDDREGTMWYLRAAEQGNVEAQNHLGFCFQVGKGVGRDSKKAVEWYRKAAGKGHAVAEYNLGVCFRKGEGVGKDLAESVVWYRKSAERGDAGAQVALGECLENGEGAAKDMREAVLWYRKSAEQGNNTAQFKLSECYRKGEGVRRDLEEAERWCRKAVENQSSEMCKQM